MSSLFSTSKSFKANNNIGTAAQLAAKLTLFNQAEAEDTKDIAAAVQLYSRFLLNTPHDDAELNKFKETAILKAAQLIKSSNDIEALAGFVRSLGPVWPAFARAKAAKLIKSLLELFDDMGDAALELEIALCRELLAWSETEKRAFLKQALDTRLIALYHRTAHYTEALVLVGTVLRQLKRLDDKLALIEVHLLESRIYFALKNVAKARAALTAARAYANAMYTPPLLQAALDVQAGLLHAEETDFKTAFSYFIEAFDNYVACDRDPRGAQALKYMLLCKIMLGLAEDVSVILAGKFGQHYPVTRHFEAMLAVAAAYQAKSLRDFETALSTFPHELGEDPIVQGHFAALYDDLLERNLLRIVLPYSRVQIAFVAGAIGLSLHDVELKLSQMILDKVLNAIIDQNSGCLVVREEPKVDRSFELVQDCFKNIGGAIDSLHVKSSRLS